MACSSFVDPYTSGEARHALGCLEKLHACVGDRVEDTFSTHTASFVQRCRAWFSRRWVGIKKTTTSLSFTPSDRTRTKPFTPRPYSIHARAPPPPQAYRPVEDRIHLGEVLLEYLEEYNVEFPSQMNLVFFADAVAHVRYVLLPCWERSSGDRGRAEASDEVKRALSSRDRVVDP